MVDSADETGQLKQAIDTNDLEQIRTLMTRHPALEKRSLLHKSPRSVP